MSLFATKRFRIPTPEQTYLEFAYAGIGRRLLAELVDTALIIGVWTLIIFLAVFLSLLASLAATPSSPGAFSFSLTVGYAAFGASLITPFLYHYLYEHHWRGQTPGKRLLNIRVMRSSGLGLDALSCILRNLVRYVDFLPYFYLIGAWSVVVTPHQQRLGDLAAGTVVVWLGQRVPRKDALEVTARLVRAGTARSNESTSRDARIREMLADYFTRRARLSNPARKLILRRLAKLAGQDPSLPQAELEQALYAHYLAQEEGILPASSATDAYSASSPNRNG